MYKNQKSIIFKLLTVCFLGILFLNCKIDAVYADNIKISGSLEITDEAILSKSSTSNDDKVQLKTIPLNYKNWTYKETNNKIILDNNYSPSGAILESSVDKTTEKDSIFQIKVDTDNPTITVKDTLGNTIREVKLSNKNLQDKQINIYIINDLLQEIGQMESMNGLSDGQQFDNQLQRYYYPFQDDGHKYKTGVHVLCNDFNGPGNKSHIYWSRKKHPAKALGNFVGSDCYYDKHDYKCIMSGNKKCKGLNKKPHNCSSIGGFSVKLHWRKYAPIVG